MKKEQIKDIFKSIIPSVKPAIKSYLLGSLTHPITHKTSSLKEMNKTGLKFLKLNITQQVIYKTLNKIEEKEEGDYKKVRNYYLSGFAAGFVMSNGVCDNSIYEEEKRIGLKSRIGKGLSYSVFSVFSNFGIDEDI